MISVNFSGKHRSSLRLRQTRFVVAGAVAALLLPAVISWAETKPSFPAPTLVVPENEELLSGTTPTIVGLAKNDSRITVYIDGKQDGQFVVKNHPSGTANFAYHPAKPLAAGTHIVHATATGPNGAMSKRSNRIVFDVVSFFPAPTLYAPVVNDETTPARPFIVGLAKNDSLIRVYIDDVLNGQFQVKNHRSGTASFSYRSLFDSAVGTHEVYVTAEGPTGKVSQESTPVRFTVPAVPVNTNVVSNSNTSKNTNGEVKGETTNGNTATTNTNGDANDNNNSAGTVGSSDSTTNYPLIVGLGLLIAVVIVAIFRIQRGESGNMARGDIFSPQGRSSTPSTGAPTTMTSPTPPAVTSDNKSPFPPPPPPLK